MTKKDPKTKTWHLKVRLFDVIFLIVLVTLYSLLAFFNLGDNVAPQTFYRLEPDYKIAVLLPKKTKVTKIKYYIGTCRNDFKLNYQVLKSDLTDNYLDEEVTYIEGLELSKGSEFKVDGPFRWRETEINRTTSILFIDNISGREIDFGELLVYSEEGIIENLNFREVENEMMIKNDDLLALTDEQDLAPIKINYKNSTYFDELYFAQTAYEYATEQEGYETVHPPLGKILQSLPIKLTGKMTPFTWRLSGTLAGILIVILLYFFAKELFESSSYGRLAGVLVSLCGLHFVQTRLGTIDSHLYLFSLLTYFFMLKFLKSDQKRYFVLSGLFFGCAFATKWSGAFAGIGLALMFFSWLYKKYLKPLTKNNWPKKIFNKKVLSYLGLGALCFVVVPAIIYFGSYLLFPKTTNAESVSDVISQSKRLFEYHSGERTPHPYSSPWFTWPVSATPIFYEDNVDKAQIWLYGNYAIAFVSVIALLVTLYFALKKKSRPALFIIVAYLSLWLPYAFIQRPMFLYHYLPASGFAILSIVDLFYELPKTRKIIPFLLLMIILVFIVSYPKYAGF